MGIIVIIEEQSLQDMWHFIAPPPFLLSLLEGQRSGPAPSKQIHGFVQEHFSRLDAFTCIFFTCNCFVNRTVGLEWSSSMVFVTPLFDESDSSDCENVFCNSATLWTPGLMFTDERKTTLAFSNIFLKSTFILPLHVVISLLLFLSTCTHDIYCLSVCLLLFLTLFLFFFKGTSSLSKLRF